MGATGLAASMRQGHPILCKSCSSPGEGGEKAAYLRPGRQWPGETRQRRPAVRKNLPDGRPTARHIGPAGWVYGSLRWVCGSRRWLCGSPWRERGSLRWAGASQQWVHASPGWLRALLRWEDGSAATGAGIPATGLGVAAMGTRIAAMGARVATMGACIPAMGEAVAAMETVAGGVGAPLAGRPLAVSPWRPAGRRSGPSPGRWTASWSASRTGGPGRSSKPSARPH